MINIAILGFGVVGGGVAAVIEENRSQIELSIHDKIQIKYILDKRDFPDSPYNNCIIRDFNTILSDPSVSIVVETMGGVHPAREFTLLALEAGKSVITSNKEVVSKCGVELTTAARQNGVFYEFEAAVGGGIPVIRGIRTSLSSDRISKIEGILNGTTNYILTQMKDNYLSFGTALSQAQALGYAEANPSADVDGLDTQRKIIILTALASGIVLNENDVYTETMTRVTSDDVIAAEKIGCAVKLIGTSLINQDSVSAFVFPAFVSKDNMLSHIDDVYNGVRIISPVTMDLMFYGRGAGRFPTAGAVVSDITSVASGAAVNEAPTFWKHATSSQVIPFSECEFQYYVRLKKEYDNTVAEYINSFFDTVTYINSKADSVDFLTSKMKEKEFQNKIQRIGAFYSLESIIRTI